MKKLTKMLLINWHYFSFELINFEDINFLTGKNAAGKSTLIDAMQVVLLGETNNYFFNKAANEKSSRTMDGYLRGELGDDGKTGFRCLREGDFNSYIAMEFNDSETKGNFVIGIIFDVFSEGNNKHRFFVYDGKIPENCFIQDEFPLSLDKLRKHLNSNSYKNIQFPETNTSYRQSLRGKLGQLHNKYFSLLKKAVPFSPITDIETFITEYVCDIKSDIDMSYMRDNLSGYKRLEKQVQMTRDRIEKLEEIEIKYSELQSQTEMVKLHKFLWEQGSLDFEVENFKSFRTQLDKTKTQINECEGTIEKLEQNINEKEKIKTDKINERAENDALKKINSLDSSIKLTTDELNKKQDKIEQVITNLNNYGKKWYELLVDVTTKLKLKANIDYLIDSCEKFKNLKFENAEDIKKINIIETRNSAETVFSEIRDFNFKNNLDIQQNSGEILENNAILNNLKKGEKQFPKEVSILKELLEENLNKKQNVDLKISILSDSMEIKNPKWINAIEGYLHTQKFNIIVPPEYFADALIIYDKFKETNNIYGAGLVDVGKIISKENRNYLNNTLADEVESNDVYVATYAKYLLGNVVKCQTVENLRDYDISITPDGMLYKNYVARRINPKRWEIPFIGKNSIIVQIQNIERKLLELNAEKNRFTEYNSILDPITKLENINANEAENIKQSFGEYNSIKDLKNEIKRLESEKSKIDLTYINQLTIEIDEIQKTISELGQEKQQNSIQIGRLLESAKELQETKIPQSEMEVKRKSTAIANLYISEWVAQKAMPRYLNERQNKSLNEIIDNFGRSFKGETTKYENKKNELDNLRADYNRIYNISHNYSDDENKDYKRALLELKDNRLVDYEEKIKDAREKTYDQFRDEFLSKLKGNFDAIKEQIASLNDAIKMSSFGNDQYRYKVEPKVEYRRYYDMINDELLLTEGINLGSFAFREKHGDAIDELFRMILEVESTQSSDERSELEKNIKRFTDYRTYLDFDLIVKDQTGREQRLSKTLLKKSGGETQTPFYLSVLASFAQIYRVHKKGFQNNTARIIIFDEAFSKMDSQRISESLQLLRKFKLQAIISAPPEKIPDITPFVDNNLCVIRENDISFVKSFTKIEDESI